MKISVWTFPPTSSRERGGSSANQPLTILWTHSQEHHHKDVRLWEQQLFLLQTCVFSCGCLPNTHASHHLMHLGQLDLMYSVFLMDWKTFTEWSAVCVKCHWLYSTTWYCTQQTCNAAWLQAARYTSFWLWCQYGQ